MLHAKRFQACIFARKREMKKFWDNRYAGVDFAYGEEPNEYFKEQLIKLRPGKILLPGDGEGRNGICAARQGWQVDSFDISKEGAKKAAQLAEKYNLKINYQVGALEELPYKAESFDVVALIFTHFNPEIRKNYRKQFVDFLKPGGLIIAELFSKKHLQYSEKNPQVGGPKDINFLASIQQIEEEFPDLEVVELYQVGAIFNEGAFHVGEGDVIRFLGRKKLSLPSMSAKTLREELKLP